MQTVLMKQLGEKRTEHDIHVVANVEWAAQWPEARAQPSPPLLPLGPPAGTGLWASAPGLPPEHTFGV